jgi:hypothetical protein
VAAAWAEIAGWSLMIGQLTPTPTPMSWVAWAMAPNVDQTNGLCPCSLIQGWKMVGYDHEVESSLFGDDRRLDKMASGVFFAG